MEMQICVISDVMLTKRVGIVSAFFRRQVGKGQAASACLHPLHRAGVEVVTTTADLAELVVDAILALRLGHTSIGANRIWAGLWIQGSRARRTVNGVSRGLKAHFMCLE